MVSYRQFSEDILTAGYLCHFIIHGRFEVKLDLNSEFKQRFIGKIRFIVKVQHDPNDLIIPSQHFRLSGL